MFALVIVLVVVLYLFWAREKLSNGEGSRTILLKYNDKLIDFNETVSIMDSMFAPDVLIGTDDGKYYTLIMFDPYFAGAEPWENRSIGTVAYKNWVVTNIPGGGSKLRINEGTVLTPYEAPNPAPQTGTHKYLFYLYEQASYVFPDVFPDVFPETHQKKSDDRNNWKWGAWAENLKLKRDAWTRIQVKPYS